MTHLLTKFLLAAAIRGILYCKTGKHRATLGWTDYLKRVAPAGTVNINFFYGLIRPRACSFNRSDRRKNCSLFGRTAV